MITFKQFLEELDALGELAVQLFFKKEMHLGPAEIEEAIKWVNGEIDTADATTDFWDHILDWVETHRDPKIYDRGNSWQIQAAAAKHVETAMREQGIEL